MDTPSNGRTRAFLILLPVVMLVLAGLACSESSSTATATPKPRALAAKAATSTPKPKAPVAPAATPTPEPVDPTVSPDDVALVVYSLATIEHIQTIGKALTALPPLMFDPQFGDREWILRVATQMAAIQVSYQRLSEIDPPPQLAHVHRVIVDAAGDCSASMDHLASGIDNLRPQDIQEATRLLQSCNDKIQRATLLLEDYKSGRAPSAAVPTANDNARLRAGPGTEYDQVGRVQQGTALTIVGRNEAGDWLMIEDRANGGRVWIAAFLVDNLPDLGSIPVVTAP